MRVKKSDLLDLSEDELAALIEASDGRHVHATFPGGKLILDETTRWCLPLIADMRGIEISDELRRSMSA